MAGRRMTLQSTLNSGCINSDVTLENHFEVTDFCDMGDERFTRDCGINKLQPDPDVVKS